MIRNLINRLDNWKVQLEKVENKLSTEKTEVNAEWNEVKTLMHDLLEQAKHSIEELNAEAKTGFDKKFNEVKTSIQEQDKELKQKISEKLHETREDLTKLADKLKTFNVLEDSKRNVIKEELKNGASNISTNFSHVGAEFKEILHEMSVRAASIKERLEDVEKRKNKEKTLYQSTIGDI
jgi:S-adenosylmethionine synthetase